LLLDHSAPAVHGDKLKELAVKGGEVTVDRLAEPCRLFQHHLKHRREITGRRIDDLQHLGRRGLLLQCLARLGQEPRVLHRDYRLRREVFQESDFFVGEQAYLTASRRNHPEKHILSPQWHEQHSADPVNLRGRPERDVIDLSCIGDLRETLTF
jgi:hypothetical protein